MENIKASISKDVLEVMWSRTSLLDQRNMWIYIKANQFWHMTTMMMTINDDDDDNNNNIDTFKLF